MPSPTPHAVTFFLPCEPDLGSLRGLDPDGAWQEFQRAERAWILQTFLRLEAVGAPVRLSPSMPAEGLVVFHAAHKRLAARGRTANTFLVAVRGDRNPVAWADAEIVQAPESADPCHAYYVAHWPQPGLVPRARHRGARLSSVTYKGYADNLAACFRSSRWLHGLSAMGLTFVDDSATYEAGRENASLSWPDYRTTDVVLAVRPRGSYRDKPPTKLVNAWLAGVPALLGKEPSFRALREDPLDYIEVTTVAEGLAALRSLLDDPQRYLAMVDRCAVRSRDYQIPSLTKAWATLLFERLPAETGRRSRRPSSLLPARLGSLLARLSPGSR